MILPSAAVRAVIHADVQAFALATSAVAHRFHSIRQSANVLPWWQ